MLVKLLTQMENVEKRLDFLQRTLQVEYKDMENRLKKAENAITALTTRLAVYGTVIVVVTPALSTLITYILNR